MVQYNRTEYILFDKQPLHAIICNLPLGVELTEPDTDKLMVRMSRDQMEMLLGIKMATGNSPSEVASPSPSPRGEKIPVPVPAKAHGDDFSPIPAPARGKIPVGDPRPRICSSPFRLIHHHSHEFIDTILEYTTNHNPKIAK